MTLAEATSGFLDYIRRNRSTIPPQLELAIAEEALRPLTSYFSPNLTLSEITPTALRDFTGRWFVDQACTSRPGVSDQLPGTHDLMNTLTEFFKWADKELGASVDRRCFPILEELSGTLPRALEITNLLSSWVRERGGAFTFPEFLTSFEEGGQSHYDIDNLDIANDVGALDGYFRIIRVEGSFAEAEELITGRQVWPIVFPANVAALLEAGFTINLEIVRVRERWQITDCGAAYPPGTEM